MPRNDGRSKFYRSNWGPKKRRFRAHRSKHNSRALRKHGRRFGKGVKGVTAYKRSVGVGDASEQRNWSEPAESKR